MVAALAGAIRSKRCAANAPRDDLDMIIGADPSGRLLEVGVVTDEAEGIDVIVHAMQARPRFLEWLP